MVYTVRIRLIPGEGTIITLRLRSVGRISMPTVYLNTSGGTPHNLIDSRCPKVLNVVTPNLPAMVRERSPSILECPVFQEVPVLDPPLLSNEPVGLMSRLAQLIIMVVSAGALLLCGKMVRPCPP